MSPARQGLFWLLALALFFLLLRLLSGMLLPFVAGFGIAYLLAPLVAWLTRWKFPRSLASVAVLLLFVLVLVTVVVLIVPVLELEATQLVRAAPALAAFARDEAQRLLDLAQQELPPEQIQKAQ